MKEKRQQERIQSRIPVYIELTAGYPEANRSGEILRCGSVNLSSGGLRVITDKALITQSILHIALQPERSQSPFFMAAEVVWCHAATQQDAYLAGLRLLPGSDSDHRQWRDHIAYSATRH